MPTAGPPPVRPKIALDYRPALLSSAGIGRAVRELARALDDVEDLDLHLFAHSLAPARVAIAPPRRAALHRLPIPGRSLPTLGRWGLGADRLAGRASVFHWTDYVTPPLSTARAVLTVHDLAFLREPSWHGANAAVLGDRTRAAAAHARAIVVPSPSTARDVATLLPGAPAPVVVPFGSDHVPTARPPRPADLPPDYALCVGTIEPRKQHRALVAAWRALPTPRPLLVVAGRPGWECDAIVADLRAAERDGVVRWLADADDERLFALLAHARLLAYPSLWEGFGFPPLEAMAMSVPVLAHDCAPLRELCDDAALLVDTANPGALNAGLQRLLADRDLAMRLATAGRARAAAFRWRDCALAHARVYREVAA